MIQPIHNGTRKVVLEGRYETSTGQGPKLSTFEQIGFVVAVSGFIARRYDPRVKPMNEEVKCEARHHPAASFGSVLR